MKKIIISVLFAFALTSCSLRNRIERTQLMVSRYPDLFLNKSSFYDTLKIKNRAFKASFFIPDNIDTTIHKNGIQLEKIGQNFNVLHKVPDTTITFKNEVIENKVFENSKDKKNILYYLILSLKIIIGIAAFLLIRRLFIELW